MGKHTSKIQWNMRNMILGDGSLRLIMPLIPRDMGELTAMAEEAISYHPDIIEWRVDYFHQATSPAALARALGELREIIKDTPLMVTPRHAAENGVKDISARDKKDIYETVIGSGKADMVDVELRYGQEYISALKEKTQKQSVKLVVSYHDLHCTPGEAEILRILQAEVQCGADICKVSFLAQTYRDILRLGDAVIQGKNTSIPVPVISVSAGNLGVLSRIAGDAFGSDAAFVSCGKTHQIHISDVRDLRSALHLS